MSDGNVLSFKKPSSNIIKAHYSAETKQLTVEFKKGRVYIYESVPSKVISDWSNRCNELDESVGKVFNEIIKDDFNYSEAEL